MANLLTRRALTLAAAVALGATAAPVGCCCIIPIPAAVSSVNAQPIERAPTPVKRSATTAARLPHQ